MAKRSPILGYNHNVRYRGLVFHVQTEDSGVMSPHLFTHLFFEGVIVSTRKLVYDASASEDAIKSLMQAQHKAVLKELNKHTFDDKIDAYLGGTPGLEPRESAAATVPRPSDPEITVELGVPEPLGERASTEPSEPIELIPARPVAAVPEVQPRAKRKSAAPPTRPVVPDEPAAKLPRTQTAERTSRGSQFRSMPPPTQDDLDNNGTVAEVHAAATIPTASPPTRPTPPPPPTPQRPAPTRAATPPPIPAAARSKAAISINPDSQPEIEIIQHDSGRNRSTRDTAVDHYDEAVPSAIGPDATVPSDGIPGRIGDSIPPLPPAPGRSSTPSRSPASHNAATLPPMRQPSRPAITPASVVSRPLPPEQRNRDNTDAIEVYAPAPPSVEPPPGEQAERPGQYSISRRAKDGEKPMREHTGRVAIPAGLGRPRGPNQSQPVRTPTSSTPPSSIVPDSIRGVPQPVRPDSAAPISERTRAASSQSDGVPRTKTPSESAPPPEKTPSVPSRAPHLTAPMASRTGTGQSGSTSGPNVIMTRPAVIVGAPPKIAGSPTPQRVRKAREDEGRGFGQGLISEKSLDEVILAYLSEDADEK